MSQCLDCAAAQSSVDSTGQWTRRNSVHGVALALLGAVELLITGFLGVTAETSHSYAAAMYSPAVLTRLDGGQVFKHLSSEVFALREPVTPRPESHDPNAQHMSA